MLGFQHLFAQQIKGRSWDSEGGHQEPKQKKRQIGPGFGKEKKMPRGWCANFWYNSQCTHTNTLSLCTHTNTLSLCKLGRRLSLRVLHKECWSQEREGEVIPKVQNSADVTQWHRTSIDHTPMGWSVSRGSWIHLAVEINISHLVPFSSVKCDNSCFNADCRPWDVTAGND